MAHPDGPDAPALQESTSASSNAISALNQPKKRWLALTAGVVGTVAAVAIAAAPVPGSERPLEEIRNEYVDLNRQLRNLPADASSERERLRQRVEIRQRQLLDNGYSQQDLNALVVALAPSAAQRSSRRQQGLTLPPGPVSRLAHIDSRSGAPVGKRAHLAHSPRGEVRR